MTSVSYTLAADANIIASELNTNFSDVVTLATAVGNDQLLGGITVDKMSDKYIPSWCTIDLLPFTSGADLASPALFAFPTSMTSIMDWQPVMKAGVEGYLCAIVVHVAAIQSDTNSNPAIDFRLNGSTVIGGGVVNMMNSDQIYLVAQNDPVTNPLVALSNGDYIEIRLGPHSGSATPDARGLSVTFVLKYPLIG